MTPFETAQARFDRLKTKQAGAAADTPEQSAFEVAQARFDRLGQAQGVVATPEKKELPESSFLDNVVAGMTGGKSNPDDPLSLITGQKFLETVEKPLAVLDAPLQIARDARNRGIDFFKALGSGDTDKILEAGKRMILFHPDNLKQAAGRIKTIPKKGVVFGDLIQENETTKEERFSGSSETLEKLGVPAGKKLVGNFTVRDAAGLALDFLEPGVDVIAATKALKKAGKAAKSTGKADEVVKAGKQSAKLPNEPPAHTPTDQAKAGGVKSPSSPAVLKSDAKRPKHPVEQSGGIEDPRGVQGFKGRAGAKTAAKTGNPDQLSGNTGQLPDITSTGAKKSIDGTAKAAVKTPEKIDALDRTSAKQKDILRDRESLGLSGLGSPERKTWETSLKNAKAKDLNTNAGRLADEIHDNGRSLSDEETAGMTIRLAELKNDYAAATKSIKPDAADSLLKTAEAERIVEEFDHISAAVKMSGTEAGRRLAALKLTIDRNYDLLTTKNRAKVARGKPLSAKQEASIGKLTTQLGDAAKKLDAAQVRHDNALANTVLRTESKFKNMSALKRQEIYAVAAEKVKNLLKSGCKING